MVCDNVTKIWKRKIIKDMYYIYFTMALSVLLFYLHNCEYNEKKM